MEAVGAAASILALALFAYETSKALYEEVERFKSHRKTVKEVQGDLGALTAVLNSIQEEIRQSTDQSKFEPLRQPLNCCVTVCQEMHEMLKQCTAHSKPDHDSIRDWLSMRYKEKSFDDVKKRLASYKSTLCIAFALVNSHNQDMTQDALTDLKDSIEGTKQDLQDELEEVQARITSAAASLQDTLRADQAQLRASLQSLEQSQSLAESVKPTITISDNRAGQASRAIFGTDSSQPNFNLNVVGNEAGDGATMSAGAYSAETLRALLQNSPNPNLTIAYQALQNTSRFANLNSLRSTSDSRARSSEGVIHHSPSINRQLLPSSADQADQSVVAGRDGTEPAPVSERVAAPNRRGNERV